VIYNNLITLLNDKGFRNIGSVDAQQVKNTLQRLPSNLNKKAEYRDKPINRILKMDIPSAHLMSIKTINTMLGCYSELFKWAIKNGYASTNVFDGMLLKDTRKARDLRAPFNPNDLKRIFSDSVIRNPHKNWQKWLPILGLYTGARLNELCQLQRKDIAKVEGYWCISITDGGNNQILKSVSSKRVIPIHKKLLDLGFIDYVSSTGSVPNSMIFPDLKLLNERYSHTPSRWFSNIKNRVLDDSDRKSFHSFRHTFVDYLYNKLKLQGNPLVKALLGHSDSEITSGVYGSSFEIEDLNQIIQSVDFEVYGISV
jgi:integrase